MTCRRSLLLALLMLTVTVAACGSDSGDSSADLGPTNELRVTGTASAATASTAPTEPAGSDAAATIPFQGVLKCNDAVSSGTGMYAESAVETCRALDEHRTVFKELEPPDQRMCAEVYGGPQRAHITGTVSGRPVDLTVTRTNSCGIGDWEQLEWLLGPPER